MRYVLLTIFLMSSSAFATQGKLILSQNRMAAGGIFDAPVKIDRQGKVDFSLNTRLQFGYFVWQHLEVAALFSLGGVIASTDDKGLELPEFQWGLGIQARYFLNFFESIYPYAGAGYLVSETNNYGLIRNHALILVGLLFPFSNDVALDFGIPIEGVFAGKLFESVEVPRITLGLHIYF